MLDCLLDEPAQDSLRSLSAAELEARVLLPAFRQLPIEPVRGEEMSLFTRDGRRFLDFYGGHAVALLGYRHPRLLAALAQQAETLFFQSNLVPLEVRAQAGERLAHFGPPELGRVFLVNSGAEANENALRLAFSRTGRGKVLAVEGSFHGRTAAAAAVTWGSASWYGFPRTPFEVEFLPRGDFEALERALAKGDVAALIAEPIQGMAGAVELGRDYLKRARELTQEQGTWLIFDEVQCGMGRSGQPFAAQLYGVTPDVLTTAKGLAGGLPAGALLTSEKVASSIKAGELGTTFGGGPLACALISAVIAAIESELLLPRVRLLSERIRQLCATGPVVDVQGAGFLLGLRTTRPAAQIQAELLAKGILVGTSADPHVVRLLPPLTAKAPHVLELAAALSELPA